jgi:hypothetical protein
MPARWRGTTNADGAEIGVSFDCSDGSIVINLFITMLLTWLSRIVIIGHGLEITNH